MTILLLLTLLTLTHAHFPPHCRCVCHSGPDALHQAKLDCALPGATLCQARLCRRYDFAGFACCSPDDEEDTVTPSWTPEDDLEGSPAPTLAKIYVAADNRSDVYINGDAVATVSHPSAVAAVTAELMRGDVVAIRAKDQGNWYGVVVAIDMDGMWHVTGGGGWKARRAFQDRGRYFEWTRGGYSSCGWPVPVVRYRGTAVLPGMALGFPYESGARYVWAADSGEFHGVFLRFVVGGEECEE